ncbi:MAG: TlpA family protein disulfide reductase [Acidimicrobiia bacterium]
MNKKRLTTTLATSLLVVAGCSSGGSGAADTGIPEDAFAIVANADLAVGPQRLLVGLATTDADSYAAPDLSVEIDLYPPDSTEPSISVPGVFIWTTPEVRGLYRAQVDFDVSGTWRVSVHTGDVGTPTEPTPFNVAEDGLTPGVGDPALPVSTPVAVNPDEIAEISTDTTPDPRFYMVSLDDAIDSGSPTVVVFATPAFCETATCGPMLDTVNEISPDYPDVTFIHVEVYENLDATSREELRLVEAVEAWNLPSEPWVFVIDGVGVVTAKFEGTVDSQELQQAVEDLT